MAEKTAYTNPPPYAPNNPPPAYNVGPAGAGYPTMPMPMPPNQEGYPAGPPTVVTVLRVGQWGPFPMQTQCPHCSATVMTETATSPGLLTWLLSGALVVLGCWLGCCLIPCCIPECQDIEHRCPSCKAALGVYRRL